MYDTPEGEKHTFKTFSRTFAVAYAAANAFLPTSFCRSLLADALVSRLVFLLCASTEKKARSEVSHGDQNDHEHQQLVDEDRLRDQRN